MGIAIQVFLASRTMSNHHLETDADVEQILRIAVGDAVRNDNTELRARLQMTAAELGLTDAQVKQAEQKWIREKRIRTDMADFMEQQKKWFWPHLIAYVAVNIGLLLLNIREWDGFPWFLFPLGGWGFGVWAHAQEVFNPKSEEFQKEFRKWRKGRHEHEEDRDDDDDD